MTIKFCVILSFAKLSQIIPNPDIHFVANANVFSKLQQKDKEPREHDDSVNSNRVVTIINLVGSTPPSISQTKNGNVPTQFLKDS